jgi:hypothetical protein
MLIVDRYLIDTQYGSDEKGEHLISIDLRQMHVEVSHESAPSSRTSIWGTKKVGPRYEFAIWTIPASPLSPHTPPAPKPPPKPPAVMRSASEEACHSVSPSTTACTASDSATTSDAERFQAAMARAGSRSFSKPLPQTPSNVSSNNSSSSNNTDTAPPQLSKSQPIPDSHAAQSNKSFFCMCNHNSLSLSLSLSL